MSAFLVSLPTISIFMDVMSTSAPKMKSMTKHGSLHIPLIKRLELLLTLMKHQHREEQAVTWKSMNVVTD